VSNWGVYGIIAALSRELDQDLFRHFDPWRSSDISSTGGPWTARPATRNARRTGFRWRSADHHHTVARAVIGTMKRLRYMYEHENRMDDRTRVDRDLIRMFLEMTPEQRVAADDRAVRAIVELRNGFKKAKSTNP